MTLAVAGKALWGVIREGETGSHAAGFAQVMLRIAGAQAMVLALYDSGVRKRLVRCEHRDDGAEEPRESVSDLQGDAADAPTELMARVCREGGRVEGAWSDVDADVSAEPYFASRQVSWLLCTRLSRGDESVAVAYLESRVGNTSEVQTRRDFQLAFHLLTAELLHEDLLTALRQEREQRETFVQEQRSAAVQEHVERVERMFAGGLAYEIKNALGLSQRALASVVGLAANDEAGTGTDGMTVAAARHASQCARISKQYSEPAVHQQILEQTAAEIQTTKEIDHLCRTAYSGVERALDVAKELLDYSRIGHERVHHVPVRLDDLLNQVRTDLAHVCAAAQAQFGVDADGLPEVLLGNEQHFYSIFRNLAQNAVEAIAESGKSQRTLQISGARSGSSYVFCVRDTGMGIPQEHQGQVFDLFFSTRPAHETGLGLGIVQRLVKLYNGSVRLESIPGEGTRFFVTMPGDIATRETHA